MKLIIKKKNIIKVSLVGHCCWIALRSLELLENKVKWRKEVGTIF